MSKSVKNTLPASTSQSRPVLHIVRRFGCVGGMENYVWNLTHQLSLLGTTVYVICEECFGDPDPKIRVTKVPKIRAEHRWQSMLSFRASVNQQIKSTSMFDSAIIHSHERSINHHVTTIHGPPMTSKHPILDWMIQNKRVKYWQKMEREEILNINVQHVIAVSNLLLRQLKTKHPELSKKTTSVGWPGVNPDKEKNRELKPDRSFKDKNSPIKCVFVGKEWKRKGLKIAIEAIELLSANYVVTLDVYGPDINEVPRKYGRSPHIHFWGWQAEIPWDEYDVLVHPAHAEPFGMVLPEARREGLAAVVSNNTGSAEMNFADTIIVSSNSSAAIWASKLSTLIESGVARDQEVQWTWSDLADLHLNEIYPKILL